MKLKDYLEEYAEKTRKEFPMYKGPYITLEEFVLKNGQEYTKRKKVVTESGNKKECFKNAYDLAQEKGLTYVEGYATTETETLLELSLHAWCIDSQGTVYDPTWAEADEYFGVAFDMDYVTQTIYHSKHYGVIDNPEGGFPLLTGEHKMFKK